jgi:hypothetical protein
VSIIWASFNFFFFFLFKTIGVPTTFKRLPVLSTRKFFKLLNDNADKGAGGGGGGGRLGDTIRLLPTIYKLSDKDSRLLTITEVNG